MRELYPTFGTGEGMGVSIGPGGVILNAYGQPAVGAGVFTEAPGHMGYYNSGFLGGLGNILSYGGAVAATIPAITRALGLGGGSSTAVARATPQTPQTAAAGPTSLTHNPTLVAAGTGSTLIKKIEGVMDPSFLGGPGGKKAKTIKVHPSGHMTVHHHRRMNPCNIKALRRSMRRAYAFERIAKRVLHFTSPKKHVTGFKHPKRRSH